MYTTRQHIKYLYILIGILFFCIFWIAELNLHTLYRKTDNNKVMSEGLDRKYQVHINYLTPRVDLLSEVGEQNAKRRIPILY